MRAKGLGRPATSRGRHRRDAILAGARRVFLLGGYDGTSINDISAAAGVSKGTIYGHFRDKEDLFIQMVKAEAEQVGASGSMDDQGSPRDALVLFGIGIIEALGNPEHIRLLRTIIAVSEKFPALGRTGFDELHARSERQLAELIAQEVSKGALDVPDLELAAEQLMAMFQSQLLLALLMPEREVPDRSVVERIAAASVGCFRAAFQKLC